MFECGEVGAVLREVLGIDDREAHWGCGRLGTALGSSQAALSSDMSTALPVGCIFKTSSQEILCGSSPGYQRGSKKQTEQLLQLAGKRNGGARQGRCVFCRMVVVQQGPGPGVL